VNIDLVGRYTADLAVKVELSTGYRLDWRCCRHALVPDSASCPNYKNALAVGSNERVGL
jgi:hypothetical protein